ncbi:MAG: chromosome segregation protein SMC, partial [Gammaproteobacteria bacterium]|nr:chromosome segregation protein SMC [Gammaproteobacteria bacterium]
MRLTRIKLAGFKSFVDPTTLQFNSNLTAVLGPNGCGKSNTIDAVRWVMGESSAKNLRGDSMTDVIFNGSSGRKPVSKASVELVFDNSDHEGSPRLGGQYASFNEIAVRREVTREGQSNYFLNGAKCRRRDITDIFLGTGLGPRSYAIIEQGTISRLIEAKPEEMRVFLEEAAGISKYKERRRETENRIKHTRENLERLDDVRHELEKQLERLNRQAKAAAKYKELQAESRDAKATLMGLRLREINQDIESYSSSLNERSVEVDAAHAELRAIETELEKNREAQADANQAFNEVQGRYYAVGADISRLEGEIRHQQELSQQQNQELEQVTHAVGELRGHQQRDAERLEELNALLDELEPRLECLAATDEEAAAAHEESEEAMEEWQNRWDAHNAAAAEPTRSAEVEQTRITHLERELQQRVQRHERLEQEHANMAELAGAGGETEGLSVAAEAAAARSQEMEDQLADISGQLETCRQREQQANHQAHEQSVALQRLEGRVSSLQALVAAAGKQDKSQSAWVAENGLEEQSRLLDQLRVEAGWEVAVETALGGFLTALSVAELDQLLPAMDADGAAGVALFDGVAVQSDAAADSLINKVRDADALAPWLAHVRVASSLADALSRRNNLAAHEVFVTERGDRVGPNWMQRAGEGEHALQNAEELRQLEAELETLRENREAEQQTLEALRGERADLEGQRDELQGQVKQALYAQQQAQSELQQAQAKQDAQQRRKEALLLELEELKQIMRRDDEELKAARARMQVATDAMSDSVGLGEKLKAEKESLQMPLMSARERYRGDRETSQQEQLQLETRRTERDSMRSNQERLELQLGGLLERQAALESALETVSDAAGEEARAELEEKLSLRVQVEARLAEARRELENFQHSYREVDQRRMQAEQGLEQKRQALETSKLGEQELKTRRESLVEQIREEDLDPKALLAHEPDAASVDEAIRIMNDIQLKISRLGAINLAAIEEFEQESERKEYLDAQHNDLVEALETLEEAIRKIDKETRERFRETFDKVNSGLQEMFPRLFGGGHASLEMTRDDLLTAGVNVMARPPGKRNSSIHL